MLNAGYFCLQKDFSELKEFINLDKAIDSIQKMLTSVQERNGLFFASMTAYAVSLLPERIYSTHKRNLFDSLQKMIQGVLFEILKIINVTIH